MDVDKIDERVASMLEPSDLDLAGRNVRVRIPEPSEAFGANVSDLQSSSEREHSREIDQ